MATGFTLSVYPWIYLARFETDNGWTERYIEQPHRSPSEEAAMDRAEFRDLLLKRNTIEGLPVVNLTTQYGFGVFEGLKALPHPDGNLYLFRPDRNANRFNRSMAGLKMPAYPQDMFVDAVKGVGRKNLDLGFAPVYDHAWEKDDFTAGHSMYMRPFTYSEPAIGLGMSSEPWVIIIATLVSSYFRPGSSSAVTTTRIRAVPGGTGWIKCDANYVTPILAKKEAEAAGYMEAIFLDAVEHRYIEEGSSCNIFFYLKNGKLVTPELQDTILPGVTRSSVLTLAQDMGVETEERKIAIDEVMADAKETFVTGTAAGIAHIESVTHRGKTAKFAGGKMGEMTRALLKELKGIQYGTIEDRHAWMVRV
ncbi:MAG: branched-chain-amino-acid transaminase [Spirochaetales bacterium]|nr:branched-chain-amino-acid transaminase [Spirochaetales bacterium]